MGKLKYPHLFEPITIGNVTFKNRMFGAPTGYLNVHGDGYFTPGAEYYYARKAMGGAASVATCEFFVGYEGRSFDKQMCLDTPNIDTELVRLAHAIDANGACPTMELQHAGMFASRPKNAGHAASHEEDTGRTELGVAYGPVEMESDGRQVLPMTDEMIEATIDKYVRGAVMGKQAGFRMVLIHAGHGWLLHQFLSPLINTRTDKWGGSVENRCRLINSIIDGIHKACGPKFPVEVRISASELYDGGFGFDVGLENAIQVAQHCNLIHASSGNHEVPEVFTKTHPSMFEPDGCEVQFSAEIKKHVDIPVATVGALSDPDLMEEIIASGKADVVEMARELICEPDFPNLVRSGRDADAKQCLRCLHCFAKEMQNGEPYCAINPQSGREMEAYYQAPMPIRKKRVLIAGGGVGGMEAALQCASRGHSVVLCEKEGALGGVLRCEEKVDFKHKFSYYLDQQARKCFENPAIDVRLNTEVTPEVADAEEADAIIAALGSYQPKPVIEGIDGANVYGSIEAYDHVPELGKNIVVIGGGLVGVEQALWLKSLGYNPIVVARHQLRDGGNHLHMIAVRNEINVRGLEVHEFMGTKAIAPDHVVCVDKDGNEVEFAADSVIYATGMVPRTSEAMALHECAPEFFPIGDCMVARDMADAVTQAYMASKNLGLV